jgi:hypothetical protein
VHYTVAYRYQAVFLTVPSQELNHKGKRTLMAGPCAPAPLVRSNFLACRIVCSEPGQSIESFDLATKLKFDLIRVFDKHRELDTR